MPNNYPYYLVWSGALNLGDTPGAFMDAQFVGLALQIPVTIGFLADANQAIEVVLTTTEVEIFGQTGHPVYWDWTPGDALPAPIGYIDDKDLIPGKPELHLLKIPGASAAVGKHWLTVIVNSDFAAGLRDDFVLRRIEAGDSVGMKVGW